MILPVKWFQEHGFTFKDKITLADVIELQEDAKNEGILSVKDRTLPEGVTVDGVRKIIRYLMAACPWEETELLNDTESLLKQLESRKDSQ